MVLTLEDMGFEIESSHHEVAPAQHEIDFKYDEALATADNIMTFKLAVKTIAKRHGMYASFMPKPKHGVMPLSQNPYPQELKPCHVWHFLPNHLDLNQSTLLSHVRWW